MRYISNSEKGELFSIFLKLSSVTGALFEVDFTENNQTRHVELEEGSYESLNRLDVSVGIMLNF